jgi:ankyrin repeat protein
MKILFSSLLFLITPFLKIQSSTLPHTQGGWSSIHICAQRGHFELLRYLVTHGGDVNLKTEVFIISFFNS